VTGAGESSSVPLYGSITITAEDGGTTLRLAGEVDVVVVRAFELAHGTAPTVVTAIDVGHVTLLSATAVALMLRYLHSSTAAGQTVLLCNSNPHVDRVLHALGVGDAFGRPPSEPN
jgi:anti-anti-sigma factor